MKKNKPSASEMQATKELRDNRRVLARKKKRVTKQARIEVTRYQRLSEAAKAESTPMSKFMDVILDSVALTQSEVMSRRIKEGIRRKKEMLKS